MTMTTVERSILKTLIERARDLAEQYANRTGWPLKDLRIIEAADEAEKLLHQSSERKVTE